MILNDAHLVHCTKRQLHIKIKKVVKPRLPLRNNFFSDYLKHERASQPFCVSIHELFSILSLLHHISTFVWIIEMV